MAAAGGEGSARISTGGRPGAAAGERGIDQRGNRQEHRQRAQRPSHRRASFAHARSSASGARVPGSTGRRAPRWARATTGAVASDNSAAAGRPAAAASPASTQMARHLGPGRRAGTDRERLLGERREHAAIDPRAGANRGGELEHLRQQRARLARLAIERRRLQLAAPVSRRRQLPRQPARGIDPAAHRHAPQDVAGAAEGTLQRVGRRARGRQRGAGVHGRQALLGAAHVVDRRVDLLARRALQAPFGDLARALRLFLFVLDVPAHQKNEIRADRALLCRDGRRRFFQRHTSERPLARPQPLNLQHDHLLRQRVPLLIRRHVEPLERDLAGAGDLDEERVGRGEPRLAGPPIARDHAVDQRIAGREPERGNGNLRAPLPRGPALARHRHRQRSFLELELLAGAGDLRVSQLEGLQAEVIRGGRTNRYGRPDIGEDQITAGRVDAHDRRAIRRHGHGQQPSIAAPRGSGRRLDCEVAALREHHLGRRGPVPLRDGHRPGREPDRPRGRRTVYDQRDAASLNRLDAIGVRLFARGKTGVGGRRHGDDDFQRRRRRGSAGLRQPRDRAANGIGCQSTRAAGYQSRGGHEHDEQHDRAR